jgi:hypothetical protein
MRGLGSIAFHAVYVSSVIAGLICTVLVGGSGLLRTVGSILVVHLVVASILLTATVLSFSLLKRFATLMELLADAAPDASDAAIKLRNTLTASGVGLLSILGLCAAMVISRLSEGHAPFG